MIFRFRITPTGWHHAHLQRTVASDDSERRRVAVNGAKSPYDDVVDAVLNVFVENVGVAFNVVGQKVCRRTDQENVVERPEIENQLLLENRKRINDIM